MRKIELTERRQEVIDWYLNGEGSTVIGRKLGLCEDIVRFRLREWGIPIRSSKESSVLSHTTKRVTTLNSNHHSIINGLLLGDGCLHIHKHGKNAHFSTKTIQEEYANSLVKLLPLDFRLPLQVIPNADTLICGKICHSKEKYVAETRCDLSLTPIYHKWYPNGKKQVPNDLVLDPLVVTHWFCGDGSTSYRFEKKSVILSFYTNGFTLQECELLTEKLNSISSDMQFIVWSNKSHNGQPIIRTSNRNTILTFFDYIQSELLGFPCFLYKQKLPLKRAA